MFKTVCFTLLVLISTQAFASQTYVGTWCNRFDDFTAVLVIDKNDKISAWSIGNEAGENTVRAYGYVSLGANAFNIILDNQDLGIVDYHIGKKLFTNLKTLTLISSDGTNEKYTECTLVKK